MKLAFDIDGVLANFTGSYGTLLTQAAQSPVLPEGWQTDPTFPSKWDWEQHYGFTEDHVKTVWTCIKTSQDFWENLEPLASEETFRQLNRLAKTNDVYFLTNRMGTNAKQQTEEFLINHGVERPTVILSGNKVPFARSVGGLDFFIDDKLETIIEFRDAEVVKQLFIQNAPYNRINLDLEVNRVKRADSVEAALREVGLWMDQVKRPVGRPRKTSPSI